MPAHLRDADALNLDGYCSSLWLDLYNTPPMPLSAIVEVFGEIRGDSSSPLLLMFPQSLKVAVSGVAFPAHS